MRRGIKARKLNTDAESACQFTFLTIERIIELG